MSTSPKRQPEPPDGRGPRPTDPNELAKWIVEQTTKGEDPEDVWADDGGTAAGPPPGCSRGDLRD